MSRCRGKLAVLGLTVAMAIGSLAFSAAPASANPPLPSNCWWAWSDFPEYMVGIAGYCVNGDGSVQWFDFNGGYGNAWWI